MIGYHNKQNGKNLLHPNSNQSINQSIFISGSEPIEQLTMYN